MTQAMTKSVQCACGKVLIVASGYNADAMPFERLCSILSCVGWACSPILCPECIRKSMSESATRPN